MSGGIDCVVRVHSVENLVEFERAVFSLVNQEYRPINIIVAMQRIDRFGVSRIEEVINRLGVFGEGVSFDLYDYQDADSRDARSMMLNKSIERGIYKYFGILDYDDILYPHAYSSLIQEIEKASVGVAFARVRCMNVDVFHDFVYLRSELNKGFSKGEDLVDLFKNNFCPIHSYVIRRDFIHESGIVYNQGIKIEEDYDMLLRFCAKYKSSFRLLDRVIGDYNFRLDRSNSVTAVSLGDPSAVNEYRKSLKVIDETKRNTVVTEEVLRALGLGGKSLTIREVAETRDKGWWER